MDPEIQLTVQHSVKDESRTGVQMLVSPNKAGIVTGYPNYWSLRCECKLSDPDVLTAG